MQHVGLWPVGAGQLMVHCFWLLKSTDKKTLKGMLHEYSMLQMFLQTNKQWLNWSVVSQLKCRVTIVTVAPTSKAERIQNVESVRNCIVSFYCHTSSTPRLSDILRKCPKCLMKLKKFWSVVGVEQVPKIFSKDPPLIIKRFCSRLTKTYF